MRIITPSSFKDYYDSLQTHSDDDVVFRRFQEKFPAMYTWSWVSPNIEKAPFPQLFRFGRFKYKISDLKDKVLPNKSIYLFTIFFCGKLYPGIQVREVDQAWCKELGTYIPVKYIEHFFYSKESLDKFCEKNQVKVQIETPAYPPADKTKILEDYFQNTTIPAECIEKLRLRKVAIVSSVLMDCSREDAQVINPCLRDWNFGKVMSAPQAFQELSMYIGGVLGADAVPMVQIADKDRVQQHGFDKWSFRKQGERSKT